jgi:hypothetical protein
MHEFFNEIDWWYHKVGTLDTCVLSSVNVPRQRLAFHLFDSLESRTFPFMTVSLHLIRYSFLSLRTLLLMFTTGVGTYISRYVNECWFVTVMQETDYIGCFKIVYWVLGPIFCDRCVAVTLTVPNADRIV